MQILLPTRQDPRLYMVCTLALFVCLAQLVLGFSQTRDQIAVALIACAAFDLVLSLANSQTLALPLSGLISGLSLCLLLDSGTRVWPFALASILAIGSKYVVKFRGKHFFNPTNFALVVVILAGLGTVTPGYQWGGGTTALWIALSMGGLILFRVRRMPLLFSFICLFATSALVRALTGRENWTLAFGVMTGAPFQLFTFFMLPDPRTTPNRGSSQVAFSTAVVAVDFGLRLVRVPNTLFLSLFLVDLVIMMMAAIGGSYDVYRWPSKLWAPAQREAPAGAEGAEAAKGATASMR